MTFLPVPHATDERAPLDTEADMSVQGYPSRKS
jgi:hypothetical protein